LIGSPATADGSLIITSSRVRECKKNCVNLLG
jgi:hypothetical protein